MSSLCYNCHKTHPPHTCEHPLQECLNCGAFGHTWNFCHRGPHRLQDDYRYFALCHNCQKWHLPNPCEEDLVQCGGCLQFGHVQEYCALNPTPGRAFLGGMEDFISHNLNAQNAQWILHSAALADEIYKIKMGAVMDALRLFTGRNHEEVRIYLANAYRGRPRTSGSTSYQTVFTQPSTSRQLPTPAAVRTDITSGLSLPPAGIPQPQVRHQPYEDYNTLAPLQLQNSDQERRQQTKSKDAIQTVASGSSSSSATNQESDATPSAPKTLADPQSICEGIPNFRTSSSVPRRAAVYKDTSRELLTQAAIITSSVALSNLLSGPSAPSPKRRFSVTPDGSDDYDARPRKSPRPDITSAVTPVHPVPAPQGFTQPSPAAPPGSDQASRQQPGNAQQTRHAQARMRSSIACARCRRSKVKCVNSGVGTPCRSCEAGNRECTYPVPVTGGRKRENSLTGPAPKVDAMTEEIRKQRQQRKSNAGLPGQPMPAYTEPSIVPADALDSSLLTPAIWKELFDIFQLHFSADLPFIHPPTFLKPLRQASSQAQAPQYRPYTNIPAPPVQPPAPTEFLLAFLALTSRFHPVLVAHHSPRNANRPSDPLIAAEFYASAASAQLNNVTTDRLGLYDISTIHAMLMLALHEWGMNRGPKAWGHLGIVIRSAQAMGLHYEEELDDQPLARSLPSRANDQQGPMDPGNTSPDASCQNDAFVKQEIRRRTLWACFILDRYFSNGKFRPQALNAKDLRIQLPAGEHAFLFGEKVRTLLLSEENPSRAEVQSQRRASLATDPSNSAHKRSSIHDSATGRSSPQDPEGRWEVGPDEGLISRYIKVLDIHGKVMRWACGGGRKRDALPPWNPQSEWYGLRKTLEDFKVGLPRHHSLTAQNTSAHINLHSSTPYALVHLTLLLSQLLLTREFLPFIPFRHGKPAGPLDGTRFDTIPSPQGFWEDSARECFAAARDIVDLIGSFQEWGVVVETPLVGFALYNVALLGVYVINFPWMDTHGYLRRTAKDDSGADAARKAIELLASMKNRLYMANGWFQTAKRSHKYFSRLRKTWVDSAARLPGVFHEQSIATAQLHPPNAESTRVLLERALRDSDDSGDSDVDMSDALAPSEMPNGARSDISSPRIGTTPPKQSFSTSAEQAQAHAQQEERWNAINSVAAAASAVADGRSLTQSAPGQNNSNNPHFRFYNAFPSNSASSTPGGSYSSHSFRAAYPEQSHSHPQTPSWTPSNGNSREPFQGIHAFTGDQRREGEALAGAAVAAHTAHHRRTSSDREIKDVESWLIALEKPFGADDVAAFVDGVEFAEYAARGSRLSRTPGWLAVIWAR
ncbi:hypothetical protein KCU65_g4343, partial [Aureobasidium melanogenum]